MRFVYWSREVAGWALVGVGLWAFWNTYTSLTNKRLLEAAPMGFVAFVIFRGGVHLLKVAVAAQAARSLPEGSAAPQARKASRLPAKAFGPTPTKAVTPGPRVRAAPNGSAD